jgi:hypothetical protein
MSDIGRKVNHRLIEDQHFNFAQRSSLSGRKEFVMTIRAEPKSLCWQRNILPRLAFLFALNVSLSAVAFAGVTISSPTNGATVASPVHVVATATSTNPITTMRIYVDNVSVFVKAANKIDTLVPMAVGKHNVVVQAWDSKNAVFKSLITITVGSVPPPPPPPPPGTSGVVITSPANGTTVASPVHVVATASSANPITTMRIYVDNVSVLVVSSNKIDTLVQMAAGNHTVVVQAWDSKGTVFKSQIAITIGTPPPPPPPTGVTVSSPHTGATLGSPVHVVASAASTNPITAMRIYLDSVSVFANSTNRIDTTIDVAAGLHNMVVQAWDSTGAVFKSPLTITVNATTTLSAEKSNNTSAADSFAGEDNGNAAAGNVSKVSTRTLLYPDSTAKIYAHFMPWFDSAKHRNPGYVSDDTEQIRKQVEDMVSRGLNGVIIDWYGDGLYSLPGETESDFIIMDHVTQLMMERAERTPGFTFAVMYDVNAITGCTACDFTQTTIDDLNHANMEYFNSPAYQKSGGRPVVYFFIPSTVTIDWARVLSGVNGNPLFFFAHETGFTHAQSDGAFAWIKPVDVESLAYLSTYYNTATASAKQSIGSAFAGFDEHLALWPNKGRQVDQQCGQLWLKTFAETKNHYSTSNQMSGIQLVTWNDYEEGTEIETGINNCIEVNATVAGTVVSWSISGQGQASTIDHFSIFVSLSGDNLLPLKDVPVTTSSLDLAQFNLEPGTYLVYIKAIGKPSLTNHMSAGVQLIVLAR